MPMAGTFRSLFVLHNRPFGNGEDIVYTLEVATVPTLLSVALASTGVSGSDLANVVAVAEGDLVGLIVTKALDVATSPQDIFASLVFRPSL